jgi:transcriptional regulator of acetoin/glycerol metabolism
VSAPKNGTAALRRPVGTSATPGDEAIHPLRHLMQKALRKHDGSVSRAAEALGISRSAFYRRLQKHGL